VSVQRTERLADQIRQELSELLARHVKDPGIGFLTLTYVRLTADLQLARVYFTVLGDEKARKETTRALDRARPFLRRQLASRLRLRRVPELEFRYDESIEKQDRIERILQEIREERGPDDEK
jgi:ribosome-binding factor A